MASEVNKMLTAVQTGEYMPTQEEQDIQEQFSLDNTSSPKKRFGPMFDAFRLNPEGEQRNDVLGLEAAQAGYGQSRYDRGEFVPEDDLENKRAIEQPGFWKIANGAIKGGIVAATTAVETVAGVLDGLLEGGNELKRQMAEGESVDFSKVIGAGVNNSIARTMADIQKLSEDWFPNYRTTAERSDEYQRDWLKHIFTANFIGDSFLKNFGFTVGAIGGGAVWSKALNAALRAGMAGNLMKGVTAAAEGNAEAKAALENTMKLINGWAAQTVDDAALIRNIEGASKALNRMNAKQQLFGAVIGAMGEGTMEGVMARDEFMEDYTEKLNRQYLQDRENRRIQLAQELQGTDAVDMRPQFDAEDNLIRVPELNEKGEAILEQEYKELARKYNESRNYSEDEGDRLAATTFLLNLPILTASNTIQFGRLFSGGWKAARNTAKVAGGIAKNAGDIAANYTATGNKALRAIGNSIKVGSSEATEEMLQGVASSGAKNVADTRLTAFNDDGYDKDAMKQYGSWLDQMVEGGKEYLGDWKNWQEGFLGMVTGLIGMPGRRWSGGIAEAVRDANEDTRNSSDAANALNNRINSDKFKNAWKGYIRHMKYENEMEKAVQADDQYTWQTANDKQLVSDIMMFANAGRLNDLKDIVDYYANMSVEDAENNDTLEAATSASNENDVKNNPSEALEKIKKQANNIKESIDMYNDMYNAMSARAPMGTTPGQLEELVATSMNIRAFEKRYLSMFDDIIKGLDKYIKPLSSTNKYGEEINSEAEKLERAKEIYSTLAEIYTGTGIPVDTPIIDAIGAVNTINQLENAINLSGDKELKQKYNDMKKVAADRKKFLKKMLTLQDLDPVKFEEQKETPEKVVKEQKKEKAKEETKNLNTADDVKREYLSRDAKGKIDFINNIEAVEDSSSPVKSFLTLKRRYDGFREYIGKHAPTTDDITATPPMFNSVVSDLLRKARNEEELINLPDNVFPSIEEFSREFTSIFGAPGPETLASIKQALRNSMSAYMGVDTATASRKSVSPTPVQQQPATGAVSTPEGYDAAQPASMEPQPEPSNNVIEKQENAGNNANRNRTIPYDALMDILTRKNRSDGDLRHQANELPDKWHEYLYLAVKSTDGNERRNSISELIKLSEKNKGNAAADAVLSAIIYEDVKQQNDNERMQSNPTVQDVTPQQPTEETLFSDAADAIVEDLPKDIEKERVSIPGQKDKIAYYRTSIPEISTEEARNAREAIQSGDREALKNADLRDFPLTDSGKNYTEIWNALNDRGAFNSIANTLEVGDKIEFVVDPTFPTFNGQYQILLTTMKDGQRITLNVLSSQTSKYHNLSELRKAIDDEYQEFKEQHPNELFVFSKKSNVWGKRAGIIDYDFSLKEEKGIVQIQGYSDDAPIAFIDRNGNPVAVRGDKDAANHVSIDFGDQSRNRGDIDGIDRRGNLYYLSKTDKNSYIPIRLNVEHFNEENIDLDNDVFNDIRKSLENISDIVKQTNNTNLESQNKKMHSEIDGLIKNLDLNGIFFEIGDYENVGIALRINDGKDSFLRKPEQMTDEWLTNLIASFDRSVQIKLDENGKIQNLERYIENDILTSNARMLRQKGVDFYFDTWDDGLGEFAPATNAIAEIEKNDAEPATQNNGPVSDNLDASFDNMFGDPSGFFDSLDTSVVVKENNVPLLTAYQSMHINELRQVLKNVSDEINKIKASKEGSERGGVQNSDVGLRQLMDRRERIEKEISAREQRRRDWDGILGSSEGFVGSEKIKALFNSLNKDKSLGEFFERVISIADSVGTKYELDEVRENNLAETKYSGKIIFDLDRLASTKLSKQRVAETIVHELVHNATISIMAQYVVNQEALSTEQKNAVTEIEDIYASVSNYLRYNNIDDPRIYKLMRSPQEMVAGVVSPNFRAFLKNVDGENFWQRLVCAIKQLLGITKNNYKPTMLDRLDKAVDNLLNNFSSEIYEDMLTFDPSSTRRIGLTNEGVFDILSRNEKVFDRSYEPGSNKFSDLSPSTMEQLVQKGYSESEWNNTPEVLRDKILKCL